MTAITPDAITAAAAAVRKLMSLPEDVGSEPDELDRAAARQILEAAAPHLGLTAQASIDALASVLPEVATERIQELEKLAAEILASYARTGDGYRGRAGQVQVARWRERLGGS